jgi:hypothetical protein
LRLDPRFRLSVYVAISALFVTGAAWLIADWLKDAANGETWQTIAAWLLMVHGGAAMLILMLLGALVPLHVDRAWRSGRNRLTAIAMLIFNGALVTTSFGLYYAGSEFLRPWLSTIHTGLGLGLPGLLVIHILVGRRRSPR